MIGRLLCKLGLHDWHYASWAPGKRHGDDCVICQRCDERRVVTSGIRFVELLYRPFVGGRM